MVTLSIPLSFSFFLMLLPLSSSFHASLSTLPKTKKQKTIRPTSYHGERWSGSVPTVGFSATSEVENGGFDSNNDDMVEISLSENNLLAFLNDDGEPDLADLLEFEAALDDVDYSNDDAPVDLLRAISSETLPVGVVVGDGFLPGGKIVCGE